MKGLFWRFFLAFWAISLLTLLIGATYIFMSEQTPPQMRLRELREIKIAEMHRALSVYGHSVKDALTNGQDLQDLQVQFSSTYELPVLISSLDGTPFALMPEPARELIERTRQSHQLEWSLLREELWVALPEQEGLPSVVAMTRLPPDSITLVGSFKAFLPLLIRRLPVEGTISLLACWLLAWRFCTPIKRLRHATQKLAAGDWSTRVVPAVGPRGDELGALAQDFDQMALELAKSRYTEQRLLRDVSHELRSPLARLNVALELVRQHAEGTQEPMLDRMQREADLMNELIGDILSLSRMESGNELARQDRIDMAPLVQHIVEDARFEAQKVGCSITLVSVADVSAQGDAALLHHALENVVRNAVKYTALGTEVQVFLHVDHNERCVVTVRDSGPGVPEEDLENIFRAFYRVDSDRDRKTGGYGVGLAIAMQAVRSHGGDIVASRPEGGGLEVSITLPIKQPSTTEGH